MIKIADIIKQYQVMSPEIIHTECILILCVGWIMQ